MSFRCIEDRRSDHPVRVMCEVRQVSPAGYYAWRAMTTPRWKESSILSRQSSSITVTTRRATRRSEISSLTSKASTIGPVSIPQSDRSHRSRWNKKQLNPVYLFEGRSRGWLRSRAERGCCARLFEDELLLVSSPFIWRLPRIRPQRRQRSLDLLGAQRVHIVGLSIGGCIAQTILILAASSRGDAYNRRLTSEVLASFAGAAAKAPRLGGQYCKPNDTRRWNWLKMFGIGVHATARQLFVAFALKLSLSGGMRGYSNNSIRPGEDLEHHQTAVRFDCP